MAKKSYSVDILSANSVNALKSQLINYRRSIDAKCEQVAMRLAELGVEFAKVNITDLDAIFTGELINSLHSEKLGNAVYAVVADSEHAIYVEMGTGIVGASHPYPGKLPAVYAQGKTIRQLANGKYGWFYQGNDGNWYFTEGMESRPFMYNTVNDLLNQIVTVVREVFN